MTNKFLKILVITSVLFLIKPSCKNKEESHNSFFTESVKFFHTELGSKNKEPPKTITVSGITRVFMHEPGRYSFLVEHNQHGKVGHLHTLTTCSEYANIQILKDLPNPEDPIWIEILCGCSPVYRTCKQIPPNFSFWEISQFGKLTIHLHSTKQVNGSGWNHGKFGSGTTVVVE